MSYHPRRPGFGKDDQDLSVFYKEITRVVVLHAGRMPKISGQIWDPAHRAIMLVIPGICLRKANEGRATLFLEIQLSLTDFFPILIYVMGKVKWLTGNESDRGRKVTGHKIHCPVCTKCKPHFTFSTLQNGGALSETICVMLF